MLSLCATAVAFSPLTTLPRLLAARAPPPALSASWAALDGATSRESTIAVLDEIKADGGAKLWGSFKLAPRPVTMREVTQTTKLDEKVLDPTAEQFSLDEIRDTFIAVVIGCTVLGFAWAALPIRDDLRFAGTYLIAGIPIGVLAIGSTAPGLLFLPVEFIRSLTASEEEKQVKGQRVCKHEASHLLCAYVLGLPAEQITTDEKGPRVVVYDEETAQLPGRFVSADSVDKLAVVAMSGFMAECDAYGKAFGAQEDFKLLNSILLRCSPVLTGQQQQDKTRYAALIAWTIIKKYSAAYEAITTALGEGKGVRECLEAAEAAEASQATQSAALEAQRAELIKKETPQERAARERAEDAARGKK